MSAYRVLAGFVGVCLVTAAASAAVVPIDETFRDGALPTGFNEADTDTAGRDIVYTANGAEFGTAADGDAGRNFIRTNGTDYHTASWTAYVTLNADPADGEWGSSEQFFFGLGTGAVGQYGVPDRNTSNDSIYVGFNCATGNGAARWRVERNDDGALNETYGATQDYPAGVTTTTHRLRMDYDATAEQVTFSVDYDWAGGTFAADQTSGALDVSALADATNGWASGDAASIFFGGDGYTTSPETPTWASDLLVVPEPATLGLLLLGVPVALRRRGRA